MAEGRRRHGRRRPVLAPLRHGPGGLTAYDTYAVRFVDTMGAGLDPSKVAASMHVYVAAGADGGFDAVSADKDGRAGTDPAKGWTDITAQCATKVAADGKTFTVRTGDLVAALGGADAFTTGARVVAVYNAPLGANCNRGATKGNPNEVYLRYPRSPLADQSGDAGFTRTPSDDACAYTGDSASSSAQARTINRSRAPNCASSMTAGAF